MKYIYRIILSDGKEYLKAYEVNIEELKEFLQHMRWMKINDNLIIATNQIASIECIAISNRGVSTLLRDDEYTIKQLNKYLKSII